MRTSGITIKGHEKGMGKKVLRRDLWLHRREENIIWIKGILSSYRWFWCHGENGVVNIPGLLAICEDVKEKSKM
jgi:hypothetical protein